MPADGRAHAAVPGVPGDAGDAGDRVLPRAAPVVLSIRVPRELHATLLALARAQQRSLNGSILHAIARYIEQTEQEGR